MSVKTRGISQYVFLGAYVVPYAFLAMYADRLWAYGLSLGWMGLLGWLSGKRDLKLALAGNFLSGLISCLCAWTLWRGDTGHFKPFSVTGWVLVLSAVSLMIQYLFWYPRTKKESWQTLLAALHKNKNRHGKNCRACFLY